MSSEQFVLSRNKFLPINKESMAKLTRRELCWIIKELKKGSSVYFMAKKRQISERWVRHIRTLYNKTGEIPEFKSQGRKSESISKEEKKLIIETFKQHPLNAVNLEIYFRVKMNRKISHNRIHRVLKEAELAKDEPKKQKRRKWVRYERKHSNSLWHTDWSELKDGRQLIIYEDDASRFIVGYGVFEHATIENGLKIFRKAAKKYGYPKQLLSDNGTQFRFNEMFDRPLDIENSFQKKLKNMKVKQVFTRIHHPQTNGKLERLFYTIKRHAKHFGTINKSIDYYNFRRPHMSLNMEILETPYQAFLRKMRK